MELVEDYLKRQRKESELICPLYLGRSPAFGACLQGKCAIFDRASGKCGFLSIAKSLHDLKKG